MTLCAPDATRQQSLREVAIFGLDDPIIPPPVAPTLPDRMYQRLIVLSNTEHLDVLHHEDATRITLDEASANRFL